MPLTQVEGRTVRLTHLERVLYPATGTTKAAILRYYTLVAPILLPHLAGRPMSFLRAPDGVGGDAFFVKHPPPGTPAWVTIAPTTRGGTTRAQIQIDGLAPLLWAANLGAVELHVPPWRSATPDVADRLVLDLDPGQGATIVDCCRVALLLRERLRADGITALVKTSGSKGLHVLAALQGATPAMAGSYAKKLAQELAASHPDLVVATMTKALRTGRVLLDHSQAGPSKTTAAAYTVRLRAQPFVSTPVSWDEIAACLAPEHLEFTIDDLPARLEQGGDLLAPLLDPAAARPLPAHGSSARRPATAPQPLKPPRRPGFKSAAAGAGTECPEPLQPPLEVMRPTTVRSIPKTDKNGSYYYQVKLDGFRCLAFARGPNRPAYLQSRSGRDLAASFPSIAAAVQASLPAGTVLDGEICAVVEGKMVFEQLLRSPRARAADGVALSLIVFDLLATHDRGDARALPLEQRWHLLTETLERVELPLQLVMSTQDRAEAQFWFNALHEHGVEGIVAKKAQSSYRPAASGTWVKIRHSETTDVRVLAVAGTRRRPRTVLVELPDGTRVMTPQLDSVQARHLVDALAGRLREPTEVSDAGALHSVEGDVWAEVALGSGRHRTVRWVRIRGE